MRGGEKGSRPDQLCPGWIRVVVLDGQGAVRRVGKTSAEVGGGVGPKRLVPTRYVEECRGEATKRVGAPRTGDGQNGHVGLARDCLGQVRQATSRIQSFWFFRNASSIESYSGIAVSSIQRKI